MAHDDKLVTLQKMGEDMIATDYAIVLFDATQALAQLHDFVDVLCDCVNNGASVGFLPPLSAEEAEAYWRDVIADVARGQIVLLGAQQDGRVIGSVQLHPSGKRNGLHRAEVAKMLVHTSARRRGIARALMTALEDEARRLGRTTLVLDTRQGEPSEILYQGMGYQKAGVIPQFARSADGTLHSTVLYYKVTGDW